MLPRACDGPNDIPTALLIFGSTWGMAPGPASAELRKVPAGQLRFAPDSPLEGDGFELSVPREIGYSFGGFGPFSVAFGSPVGRDPSPKGTHPLATGSSFESIARQYRGRTPRQKAVAEPMVRRLFAGGDWIRTSSTRAR